MKDNSFPSLRARRTLARSGYGGLVGSREVEQREDIKFGPKYDLIPMKGKKPDKEKIDEVLDAYFNVCGWGNKAAFPSEEKMREQCILETYMPQFVPD